MTMVGTYGAKRQSQRKASPRDVLRKMIDKYPDRKTCQGMFEDRVIPDNITPSQRDMLEAIIEYWFTNNFNSLRDEEMRFTPAAQRERKAQKKDAASLVETTIEIIKSRAEKMVLLEMVMPNGKSLAGCTFAEVARFGGKFTALSKGGKPNEKVGKLSEAAVRKLFR